MPDYTKIIDTHAHYEDKAFDDDRDILLNDIHKSHIAAIVNISSSPATISTSAQLATEYPFIYTSVGVHPDNASELDEDIFSGFFELAKQEKSVTIGEIGLDYYWNKSKKDIQIKWFRRQIELARSLNLPINIHSRDAAKDTYDILHEYYPYSDYCPGVMHCYSYSCELAAEAVKMGFMLGIGGVVTFKNANVLLRVVEETPLDHIVLETDSPYLAPEPFRGKRNNSSHLQYVAQKIAAIKELDVMDVISITTQNALRLYPKLKLI